MVEAKDVDHCRVRVLLNGLKPLEMKMDISLPSGDEIPVELKYEKLEKHCFHCFALSHEKKDCPLLPPALRSSSSHLGVTQLNTLDRLEANRRRLEDRRPPRQLSLSRDREWRREPSHSLHRSSDKTYVSDYIRRDYRKNYDSQGCYERDRTSLARRTDDYSLSRSENQRNHTARPPPGHPPPPTWRPVTMAGNLKTPTQSIQSQVSHTPSPRPLREVMLPPGNATARNTGDHEPHSRERRSALERISVPGHDTDRTEAQHEKVSSTKSPGSQQHGTEERRSALERLTSPITPGHGVIDSQQMHDPYHETPDVLAPGASDRRPARERLSGQPTRVPLLHNGVANLDSGRLQEVNIQYLEDTLPPVSGGLSLGSSSRAQTFNFGTVNEALHGNSPIRSLSEDRLHVALRLGPVFSDPDEHSVPGNSQAPLRSARIALIAAKAAKAAGKKKVSSLATKTTSRKRGNQSPLPGISLKKRRVTKSSPKRRSKVAGSKENAVAQSNLTNTQPRAILIPATSKRGTDFQTVPSSLP